jgi:predicted MarR family transcription regulator
MALAGSLAAFVHTITGTFTNKSLRAVVTTLSMTDHTSARMTYDLRRLRLKGLIERIPRSNAHRITDDGLRFAVFYTKLHDRLLTPLLATDQLPAPPEVRHALNVLAQHTDRAIALARPHAA